MTAPATTAPRRSLTEGPAAPRTTTAPGRRPPVALRPAPTTPEVRPRRRFAHAPGSNQVISVRGRRVIAAPKADARLVRGITTLIALLVVGVVGTMMLSTWTTTQSFAIQELTNQQADLRNRIETQRRNLEEQRAAANLAEKAVAAGMIVPGQVGILSVDPQGVTAQQLAADPAKQLPLVDVNAATAKGMTAAAAPTETAAAAPASAAAAAGAAAQGQATAPGGVATMPYQTNRAR